MTEEFLEDVLKHREDFEVVWIDPYRQAITVDEAILRVKEFAEEMGVDGGSELNMLEEFIVVHWADVRRKADAG